MKTKKLIINICKFFLILFITTFTSCNFLHPTTSDFTVKASDIIKALNSGDSFVVKEIYDPEMGYYTQDTSYFITIKLTGIGSTHFEKTICTYFNDEELDMEDEAGNRYWDGITTVPNIIFTGVPHGSYDIDIYVAQVPEYELEDVKFYLNEEKDTLMYKKQYGRDYCFVYNPYNYSAHIRKTISSGIQKLELDLNFNDTGKKIGSIILDKDAPQTMLQEKIVNEYDCILGPDSYIYFPSVGNDDKAFAIICVSQEVGNSAAPYIKPIPTQTKIKGSTFINMCLDALAYQEGKENYQAKIGNAVGN